MSDMNKVVAQVAEQWGKLKVENAGAKFDSDKPQVDLLSPVALTELSKVLTFGAHKYASWNWSKGIAYSRVLAALLRHVFKYMSGEDKDPETGLSHMAHAMCNCMFLLHFEVYRQQFDDRNKEAFKISSPGEGTKTERSSS